MCRIMIQILSILIPLMLSATKYAGEFQELGAGGRAWAMGGTGVAQCADPSVIYFNPAGTALLHRSILLMHAENFAGIVKNDFGSVVLPKGSMAIGIGFQYVSCSGIKFTQVADTNLLPGPDNPPIPYDTVSSKDMIFYLNSARAKGLLSYGANLKVYYRDLSIITGLGAGIDLGLRLNSRNLKIGIAIRDFILSPIVWNSKTKETISSKITFGVGPEIPLERFSAVITIESAVVKTLDIKGFGLNFGFEYAYKNFLFGRCGIANGNVTLGAGLRYKKIVLDYALVTHTDLNNSNKFSAGLKF